MERALPVPRHPLGSIRLTEPTRDQVLAAMQAGTVAPFTYLQLGGTRDGAPKGWRTDHLTRVVGRGDDDWLRAVEALRSWSQFDLGWVRPHDRTVPIVPGATFAFVSKQVGVYSLNVCRIVYVIDEPAGPVRRFGFAYGTVGDHVVRGEERFLLTQDGQGQVAFAIDKFSKPANPLVWLAGPVATRLQRRFSEEAVERLAREVACADPP